QQAWANAQYLRWPTEQAIAQAAYQQVMAEMAAGRIPSASAAAGGAGGSGGGNVSTSAATQQPAMDPATLKQWKDYISQCDKAIADAPKEKRKEMKDYVDNLKRQYGLTDAMLHGDSEKVETKEAAAAPEEPAPVDRRLAGMSKATPTASAAEESTD
ncbi:hypothetical protein Pmar_PMAR005075, partial [Perkinsus marinus ATCC 50983]